MPFSCILSLFVFSFMKESLETIVQKEVNLGDTVTLHCTISYHFEITWMRHGLDQIPRVLLVAGLEDDDKMFVRYQQNRRFTGVKLNRSIALEVSGITGSDYALLYYCAGKEGQTLRFGNGIKLIDPTRSGTPPTTPVTKDLGEYEKAGRSSPGGLPFFPLYAALLGCGLLGMICAVAAVHLKSWRRLSA